MRPVTPEAPYRLVVLSLWLLPLSAILSAVVILVASGMLAARSRRAGSVRAGKAWIFYLGAVFLSATASVQPAVSWLWALAAAGYLLVTWVFGTVCDTPDRLRGALQAVFWGALPWEVVGIALSVAKVDWYGHWGPVAVQLGFPDHRADSIFFHPNIFAGYLLLALGAGLGLGAHRPRTYGPALLLLGVCMLMTQSRSAWIGAIVELAAFTAQICGGMGACRPRARSWLLVAGAGLLAIVPLARLVWARTLTLLNPNYGSNEGHLRVWGAALRMIAARPLLGWGPGTWAAVYPRFRDPAELEHLPHAHSIYLDVGAEQGVMALLGLLVFFAMVVVRAMRAKPADFRTATITSALSAAVMGYFAMGLFEYTYSEGRNCILLFGTAGFLVALTARAQIRDRLAETASS